jgi:hypothetical protein
MRSLKGALVFISAMILILVAFSPVIVAGEDDERPNKDGRPPKDGDRPPKEEEKPEVEEEFELISFREFVGMIHEKGVRIEQDFLQRVFNSADADDDSLLNERELYHAFELIHKMMEDDQEEDDEEEEEVKSITYREFYTKLIENGYEEQYIKRVFEASDINGDDILEGREIKKAHMFLRGERSEKEDEGRSITLREFFAKFKGKMKEEVLKRIFTSADINEDGKLEARELKKALEMIKDKAGDWKEDREKMIEDKDRCREGRQHKRSNIRTHFEMVDENSDGIPDMIHIIIHINNDDEPDVIIKIADENSDGNPEIVAMEMNLPPVMMGFLLRILMEFRENREFHQEEWCEEEDWYMERENWEEKEDWNKDEWDEKEYRDWDNKEEKKDQYEEEGPKDELSEEFDENSDDKDIRSVDSSGSDGDEISPALFAAIIGLFVVAIIGLVVGSFILIRKRNNTFDL